MAQDLEEIVAASRALNPGVPDAVIRAAAMMRYGGAKEQPKPEGERGWGELAGDMALKGAQGVVGLGQSVVGLGDIATGGMIGKVAEAAGYDPKRAKEMIASASSDKQKMLDRVVGEAGQGKGIVDGFVDQIGAIVDNPSVIPGVLMESLPSMLAAGGGARALGQRIYGAAIKEATAAGLAGEAAAAKAAQVLESSASALKWAAAGGEGALTAGQIADTARGEGRTWNQYVLPALTAGAGTAAIGRAAGSIPGLGDAETAAFTGVGRAAATGNRAIRTGKGMLQEGVLEEMPQSAQEQAFTNLATGKPIEEGVGAAAAQGLIAGTAMGGAMGAISRANTPADNRRETPTDAATLDREQRKQAIQDIATAPDVDSAIAAFNVATAPSPDLAAARTDPIEFDRLGALGMINAAPAPSAPTDTGEAIPYDYSQRQQMYPALPAPETASGRDVPVNDTDPQLTRPEQMGDREAAINYQQAQREQAESDRDLGITPGTRKAIRARITLDEAGNIIDAPDGDRQFLSLVRREARPHAAAAIEAHSINPTLTEAALAAPNMGPKAERTVFEAIINGNPADQQTRTLLERYGVPGRLADSNGQGAQPVNPAPPGQQPAGDQRQPAAGPRQTGTGPDAGNDNRDQGVAPATTPAPVPRPLTVKTDAELRLQAKNTRAPAELKAISDELARRKAARPETEQDKSRKEWQDNYDRVANAPDLSKISTKDIERAINYASHRLASEGRKSWDGGEANTTLIDSIRREVDNLKFALKQRQQPATTTPAAPESGAAPLAGKEAYEWAIKNRPYTIAVGLSGDSVPMAFQQRQQAQKRLDLASKAKRAEYTIVGIGSGAGRRFYVVPTLEKYLALEGAKLDAQKKAAPAEKQEAKTEEQPAENRGAQPEPEPPKETDQQYSRRIMREMAEAKKAREAEEAAAAEEAKYQPFNAADIKKPTPSSIGLTATTAAWFRARFEGRTVWTNGHIVDFAGGPKGAEKYTSARDYPEESNQPDIAKIMPKQRATISGRPVAFYNDKNKKGEAVNSVGLLFEDGKVVAINRDYFAYFTTSYPGAEFKIGKDYSDTGPVTVERNGQIIGLAMPMKQYEAYFDKVREMASDQPPPTPVAESQVPVPSEPGNRGVAPAQEKGAAEPVSREAPKAKIGDVGEVLEGDNGNVALASRTARPGYAPPYTRPEAYRFETGTDANGLPKFRSDAIGLANARVKDAFGVPKGGRAIAFDIYDMVMPDARGEPTLAGSVLAHMDAAGKFASFRNISIKKEFRDRGYYHGEGTVLGMLQHNGATAMEVYNIQSAARGDEDDALPFWKKIGTTILNYSTTQDVDIEGNISLARYLDAAKKRSADYAKRQAGDARAAQGASGRNATRPGNTDTGATTGAEARRGRGGLSVEEVRRVAQGFSSRLVRVVQSTADLPESAARFKSDEGGIRGVFIPATDEIYLIADNLHSPLEVAFVVMHEGLHRGLRAFFGADIAPILSQIANTNAKVRKATAEYQAKYDIGRMEAIEEVLADMALAGSAKDLTGWEKLVAFIRKWVAALGDKLGFQLRFSDDMVEMLVGAAARRGLQDEPTAFDDAVAVRYARVYHGTPHNVDRFSTDKIGTGEGAQAYGWGLYFAENPGVAEGYRKSLAGSEFEYADTASHERMRMLTNFDDWLWDYVRTAGADANYDAKTIVARLEENAQRYSKGREEMREIAQMIAQGKVKLKPAGAVYQVDIPDEVVARMLEWDRPLSEQPEGVREALERKADEFFAAQAEAAGMNIDAYESMLIDTRAKYPPQTSKGATGEEYYRALADYFGSQKKASEYLDAAGIPGIKYLDAGSRNRPLREIKKEFLAELPEDADFEEVRDLIGTGKFSPQNEAILQALDADDWLGFDYPAQALSAALSKDAGGFEMSPELRQAISAAQDGGTRNLVVFNDKNITITHKDGTPVTAKERADLVMASRPDDAPMASRNQTSTPAFKAWFGDSKVVDENGAPLVVYHGTAANFDVYSKKLRGTVTEASDAKVGFWFTDNPHRASLAADDAQAMRADDAGANVQSVFLSIQKPYEDWESLGDPASTARTIRKAKRSGHDGVIFMAGEMGGTNYVVFEPGQIKSAIGNNGNFDPNEPSILASRGTIGATWDMLQSAKTPAQARTLAMNLFDNPNKFNLWDKTIGTQLTKARKNEYFRAVFDNLQGQQDSTAAYAIEAEAEAADVLARMEGLGEIKSALKSTFTGLKFEKGSILPQGERARDLQAVSKAIFSNIEGEQGVKQKVFTDAELAKDFGLNERQIGLYRQSRAAIDRSLDRYAQSLAVRMAQKFVSTGDLHRAGLDDTVTALTERLRLQRQTLEEQREPEQSVEDMEARLAELEELRDSAPREILRSLQTGPDGETRQEFVGMPDTAAATALDREIRDLKKAIRSGDGFNSANRELDAKIEALDAALSKLPEIQEQANSLKDKGYAPAMRFGDYAVTATQDGETVFFTMVDTKTQANLLKMRLAREMPGAELRVNAVDRESFKLFGGVDPATVELFARFMEVEENDAFKAYIALATSSRSALKHMLERKGIAGFSDNLPRVMAAFITSNARAAARNIHGFDVNEAMEAAQKKARGDVSEEAAKLVNYMNNPTGDFAKVRGFMFAYFMGGSVSSALVNLTQPLMMTTPYLEQFAGKKIGGIMVRASKAAATGKVEGPMKAALERAEAEGITDAHEYHQLMQEAEGGGSVATRALMKSWGSMFGAAERFNRRITFLAAFEVGQGMTKEELSKQRVGDAYEFAKQAVVETQGLYNRANRPNWARNPVGALAMTFKQFSIAWIEFFMRLPRKQQLMALGLLILMAGIEGLPFAEDIEDLIDTIGQRMGRGTNSKKALRTAATNLLGETGAQFALHGISGLAGMPMDVAGRLGMGNLIPGTKLLNPSVKEKGREVAEIAGPVSGLVQKAGGLADGNLKEAMPKAFADAAKAWEMIQTGEYRDTRGRKVMDVDGMDSLMKMIGFQPRDVAANTRFIGENMRDVDIVKRVEAEIVEQWADGIRNKDVAESQEARERLKRWNAENPDLPIKVKFSQILQRVRAANLSRDERFMKTAPPELRRRMLAEAVQ